MLTGEAATETASIAAMHIIKKSSIDTKATDLEKKQTIREVTHSHELYNC